MEYTKGEWRYCQANKEEGCSCGLIWSIDQDAVVARAIERDDCGFRPHKQMVANARLIAQAPRLYEALEKAQQDINWMLNNKQFLNPECFEYIEQAIAAVEEK